MRKTSRVILTFCLSLSLVTPLAAQNQQHDALPVVASFSILADWVRQIGGEHVSVHSLVEIDQDSHVFRARPQDVRKVTQAELLVVNGLGFEGWLERLIAASGYRGEVLVASKGIDRLLSVDREDDHHSHHDHGHHHGHDHEAHTDPKKSYDPHAWHSLNAAKIYTSNIAQALSRIAPAHAKDFTAALNSYHNKLDALKARYQPVIAQIPSAQRQIVVPHNSFAYLGREFGLTIHALQGISTEAESSAQDLARIVTEIRKHKVRAIFLENVSNPRLIEQVQRETGVMLGGELISDALSRNRAETYLALMEHNLRLITEALARP